MREARAKVLGSDGGQTRRAPSGRGRSSVSRASKLSPYVSFLESDIHITCNKPTGTTPVNPVTLGPTSITLSARGTWSTFFGLVPSPLEFAVQRNGSSSTYSISSAWNTTLYATGTVTVTSNGAVVHRSLGPPALAESVQMSVPVTAGTYTVYANVTDLGGGYNHSWTPILAAGSELQAAQTSTVLSTCAVDLSGAAPASVQVPEGFQSNTTATSVTLVWSANTSASAAVGWIRYREAFGPWMEQTAVETAHSGGQDDFRVQLSGLTPWGFYEAEVGVTTEISNCASFEPSDPVNFSTAAVPQLAEYDLPFDSITQEGGGAVVDFPLPGNVLDSGSNFSLAVADHTTTAPGNVTDLNLTSGEFSLTATTVAFNLSMLTPNRVYDLTVDFDYTIGSAHLTAQNSTFSFWYLKDTTGDGLTDSEKVQGWDVTTQTLNGTYSTQHVTADPNAYATNGLVNDFIEKEYGLNPRTVDTAGSHMLDTWNLTFSLGPTGGALPLGSNFKVWYENASYDPFAPSVAYSPGVWEDGSPVQQGLTNISSSAPIRTSGDGAAYAARVLWSYTALETFVALPGVKNASWLRAVEGTWNGTPTLTVWGKLSWGANPLAASTPDDSIPDGSRINPLQTESLSVNVSNLYVKGLQSGQGYAALFRLFDGPTPAGTPVLSNYSAPVGLSGGTARLTDYRVVLPVSQTSAFQTLQLEILVNESGSSTLTPVAFDTGATVANVTYDMVSATALSETFGSVNSTPNGSLSMTLQGIPVGGKAPTWLWIPSDNSTENALPVGLQRYTGEPSFDLVVVNASGSITSDQLPMPWGGTNGTITLAPGLNDFLIPREQFLDSPLGQAIFLGRNTSYNASAGAPALIGSAEEGYLTGFDGANLMVDLGAYWQNRSIATGPGNLTGSTEKGTLAGNPMEVQVMAATTATGDNTGGLPSDPALYSTVGTPSALQSILTLNITSTATLDLLLAGMIDTTTGGSNAVNGTFESVTGEVGFLGLAPSVLAALANAAVTSEGLYGAPGYNEAPPESGGAWGEFWNAVSAVEKDPLGTVLSLVGTVWSAASAAFTYLNHLAEEAAAIGAEIVARTAEALVEVGQVIASAMKALLNWLWQEMANFFESAITGLTSAFKAAKATWVSENLAAANETIAGMNGTAGAFSRAQSELQAALLGPLSLEVAITVAVSIVIYVALPFEIGPGTLVSFLVPIIVSALGATLSLGGGESLLGMVGQFLSGGIGSTFAWLESASEWIWNLTHPSLNSSAVTSFLAPDVPGDHWTFIAFLPGTIGAIASQVSIPLLRAAGEGNFFMRLNLFEAATGLAFLAVILVLSEYLLSISAPSGLATTVAEGALDVGALSLGFVSILFGVVAESGGEDVPVPAPAEILGWVGIGAGLTAEAAGAIDLAALSQGG